MAQTSYDLLIVGTGPAGMTAALYGQRLGLRTVVFGDVPGGSLYMIDRLSNFPGFIDGIAGMELGAKMFQQAQAEGAHFSMSRLERLKFAEGVFHGGEADGQTCSAATALVATGRVPTRLAVPGANLKGVHFCSVCDGPLYRNQNATLAVVGSDNAAAQHAITLARIAKRVLFIHRSAKTKMDAGQAALLARQENVEMHPETEIVGLNGLDRLAALVIRQRQGRPYEMPVDGLFLAVGWRPNTDLIDFQLAKTPNGYLKTDVALMTSLPGLFAAGDVRDTELWQVLTACADGARAAKSAAAYLARQAST